MLSYCTSISYWANTSFVFYYTVYMNNKTVMSCKLFWVCFHIFLILFLSFQMSYEMNNRYNICPSNMILTIRRLNFVFLSDKEAFRGTETRVWEEEWKDESIRRTFWKANSSKHPDQLKQEYNKHRNYCTWKTISKANTSFAASVRIIPLDSLYVTICHIICTVILVMLILII